MGKFDIWRLRIWKHVCTPRQGICEFESAGSNLWNRKELFLSREGIVFILTKLCTFFLERIDAHVYPRPSRYNSIVLFGNCSYELPANSAGTESVLRSWLLPCYSWNSPHVVEPKNSSSNEKKVIIRLLNTKKIRLLKSNTKWWWPSCLAILDRSLMFVLPYITDTIT